jgi:hypothetical protein
VSGDGAAWMTVLADIWFIAKHLLSCGLWMLFGIMLASDDEDANGWAFVPFIVAVVWELNIWGVI